MLILGLGRSALLCNMLKLMRCNKWANPPKACPLWQKHKAFRQARRCLCLSRRQARSSRRLSISRWEKAWTWRIARDMCPGSSPRVQEVSSVVREQSLTMRAIHGGLQRNIWSDSGLLCSMRTWPHTDRNVQSGSIYNNCTVIICCWIYVFKKKCSFLSHFHVHQTQS